MSSKRLAQTGLLLFILLGIGCLVGLAIWRSGQADQPVALWANTSAKLLVGGIVLAVLGGIASVGLWLFAAAPTHPDAPAKQPKH